MAFDPAEGGVLLYGGYNPPYGSVTWLFSNDTWTKLPTQTNPGLLEGAAFAYDYSSGYAVLFGGVVSGSTAYATSATWIFQNGTWLNISSSTSAHPTPRAGAAMAYDAAIGGLVLFGGWSSSSVALNDTWEFVDGNWTGVQPSGSPPPDSLGISLTACEEPTSSGILMAGDNGTWLFANGNWSQLVGSAGTPADSNISTLAWDPWYELPLLLVRGSLPLVYYFSRDQWVLLNPSTQAVNPLWNFQGFSYDRTIGAFVTILNPVDASANNPAVQTWLFGSAAIGVGPTPSYNGTVDFNGSGYTTPTTIQLGFGTSYTINETQTNWSRFSHWSATGGVQLISTYLPPSEAVFRVIGNGTVRAEYRPFPGVLVVTEPSSCGTVTINGTAYGNGAVAHEFAGPTTVSAAGCTTGGWFFGRWNSSGNLTIDNRNSSTATMTVGGTGGTLMAIFLANVTIDLVPPWDGSFSIDGATFPSGTTATLESGPHSLRAAPDPWAQFEGWNAPPQLTIDGAKLVVNGSGLLTGSFQLIPSLEVLSTVACPPIIVNGTGVRTSNTILVPSRTPVSVSAPDCSSAGYVFHDWTSSANVTVLNRSSISTSVTLLGNGSLAANYVRGYIVSWQVDPTSLGRILLNGTLEPNGSRSLLAPGTYRLVASASAASGNVTPSYRWVCSGEVYVNGSEFLVWGPGSVTLGPSPSSQHHSSPSAGSSLPTEIAIGLPIVVVALAILLYSGRRRRKRQRSRAQDGASTSRAGTSGDRYP